MSKLYRLNYFSTVGIEGELVVEDCAEVEEFRDFEYGERKRGRGVGAGEDPWLSDACLAVCFCLFKDDDAGFGDRDGQTIEITGVLGSVEEALHVRMEMGDEVEVVDVKKDTEKDDGVGVGEGEVRVFSLEGMYEIGGVQSPEKGGVARGPKGYDSHETGRGVGRGRRRGRPVQCRRRRRWWVDGRWSARVDVRCKIEGCRLYRSSGGGADKHLERG